MVFEDLYKKTCFLKMTRYQKTCFLKMTRYQKTLFFIKKYLAKKRMFFMVDKTKQKLLFENYECFSKKEKKCLLRNEYICNLSFSNFPGGTWGVHYTGFSCFS